MFEPGFYEDVPELDYHSGTFGPAEGSLSVSGAKTLLKAPALFRWQQDHPVHKNVFDFGSAAHALVLGKGMESIYIAPYDDWRTKAAQEEQKIARGDGLSPILPKDWLVVCDMADALSGNSLAMELLSRGRAEVSAYAPDPPTGVWRRCRFDWLAEDILSDYKSANDADPNGLDRTVFNFGYYMQAAWYLDLARDLGHRARAFAFIVQEKEPPYLPSVVDLDADAMRLGREKNREALERFRDCRESGLWPGYQAGGCFTTISLPRWAYREAIA